MKILRKKILSVLASFAMSVCCVAGLATVKATTNAVADAANSSANKVEFTVEDTTYVNEWVQNGNAQNAVLSSNMSYVTDVDTDEDGNVDAATAMKVSWTAQWAFFGVQFTNPVALADVSGFTIRYYANFTNNVHMLMLGEKDGYKQTINTTAWWNDKCVEKGGWVEQTIDNPELIPYLADDDGMINSLYFLFGYDAAYNSDAYFLLDSITWYKNAVITLDNDTANTGVENSTVATLAGETMRDPGSQIFGKEAVWYADEARTQPFDFSTTITDDMTLYGKYTDVENELGVISQFTKGDTRYLDTEELPASSMDPAKLPYSESKFNYVTGVDLDGDGEIEAENALKVVGFTADASPTNWLSFALEFTPAVDISMVAAVKIRFYSHLADEVYVRWCGENGGTWTGVTPWAATTQDEWVELEIGGEYLANMAGADGKIDTLGVAVGKVGNYYSDAFLLIDSITYDYACTVTYDHDTENSGVENTSEVVQSGKRLTAPKSKKAGYDVEWFKDEARTIPFDFKNERVTENITIYGKYSVKQLTVTFDHDEATTGLASEEVSVTYGEKVAMPENTLDGYTVEWYLDVYYTEAFDFEATEITEDITIYAKYTKVEASKKGGCSCFIGATAIPVAAVLVGALCVGLKKKED